MRASAVIVWINCQLFPVTYGHLNLTLLPIDVGSLSSQKHVNCLEEEYDCAVEAGNVYAEAECSKLAQPRAGRARRQFKNSSLPRLVLKQVLNF